MNIKERPMHLMNMTTNSSSCQRKLFRIKFEASINGINRLQYSIKLSKTEHAHTQHTRLIPRTTCIFRIENAQALPAIV